MEQLYPGFMGSHLTSIATVLHCRQGYWGLAQVDVFMRLVTGKKTVTDTILCFFFQDSFSCQLFNFHRLLLLFHAGAHIIVLYSLLWVLFSFSLLLLAHTSSCLLNAPMCCFGWGGRLGWCPRMTDSSHRLAEIRPHMENAQCKQPSTTQYTVHTMKPGCLLNNLLNEDADIVQDTSLAGVR